jgi:hypothetical protein
MLDFMLRSTANFAFLNGSIKFMDRTLELQKVEAPNPHENLAHEGCKVVSPTYRPPLSSRKYSWYSYLLEDESTPGYSAGGKIKLMKDQDYPIGNRTHYLSACSTVPQQTATACPVESTVKFLNSDKRGQRRRWRNMKLRIS